MGQLQSAYSVILGSTVLSGLSSLSANTNPEITAPVTIGSQFPQFAILRGMKPQINFQTEAILAVLTAIGVKGLNLATAGVCQANFVNLTDGVPDVDGSAYTMAQGYIMPRALQVAHQQSATLDVQVLARSTDGTSAPMVTGAATIGALLRNNIQHTLKSAKFGAIILDDLTNIQIEFGVNAQVLATNSDIYPKHIMIDGGITPKITITTYDVTKIAGITLEAKRGTHADSSIVLRQYDADGVGYDDGTGDIEITMSGLAVVQTHSAQGNQVSSATIEITADWDGTNSPILIS